jgi:hypothetical protein
MQGYSINGYINAVIRRSEKTLLLEGVTDKSLLKRLLLDLSISQSHSPKGQIDCVQIISDTSLSTLGNKARIIEIGRAALDLPSPTREKLLEKFGSLIDREWDGLDTSSGSLTNWNPPTQLTSSFTTIGHSIENYFFNVSGTAAYLRQAFPDDISVALLSNLEVRFHQIVALATSFSLQLRDKKAITRAGGAICNQCIAWECDRYYLTSKIDGVLQSRGLNLPPNFHTQINCDIDNYLNQYQSVEPGRWLCHGHLGEQAIWSCIGNLAIEHGLSKEVSNAIERGSQTMRHKHAADHLCDLTAQERLPLDDAVAWLVS